MEDIMGLNELLPQISDYQTKLNLINYLKRLNENENDI